MIKLLRSSIASAALGWAWKNRSKIASAVTDMRAKKAPTNPTTGYGNTVGKKALVDPADVTTPTP